MMERQFELLTRARRIAALVPGRKPESHLPEQLTPGETEPIAPAHPHQVVQGIARQPGRGAADHFSRAVKQAALLALEHQGLGDVFSPLANETQADTNAVTAAGDRLHGAPDI